MTSTPLHTEIAKVKANLEALAERIGRQPDSLPEILDGLQIDQARTRYGCLKVLRLLSEKRPAVLYPFFDLFAGLLGSDNSFLRWGAIIIVGNLSAVDSKSKIDALLDEYLQPISGPVLITAANTIRGAGRVAQAKPHLVDRIVQALLQVKKAKYQTPECRNVALGHVRKSLGLFFEHVRDPQVVIDFAKRQLRNRRNAVKLRAHAFLKKHEGIV
jgi:hypothetical protein